jgi:hypothetical protein
MRAYIEVVGAVTVWGVKLTRWDRWRIGEFTRENVFDWLSHYDRRHYGMDCCHYPEDFHAVCGDQDIPWADKESATIYEKWTG